MASESHTLEEPEVSPDFVDGQFQAERKSSSAFKMFSLFFAFSCMNKKPPSMSDEGEPEEEVAEDPMSLVGGRVHLRKTFQLTASHETHSDRTGPHPVREWAITPDGKTGCTRRGPVPESAPQPVQTPPRVVFLKKDGKFGSEFMAAVQGKVIMKTTSRLDEEVQFLKKDYILDDGAWCSTFMSLLVKKCLGVDKDQVDFWDFNGDPSTCVHPCLFIVEDTGTTQLIPTVAPGKYLGYEGNRVVVSDQRISFEMLSPDNVTLLPVTITHPETISGVLPTAMDGRPSPCDRLLMQRTGMTLTSVFAGPVVRSLACLGLQQHPCTTSSGERSPTT